MRATLHEEAAAYMAATGTHPRPCVGPAIIFDFLDDKYYTPSNTHDAIKYGVKIIPYPGGIYLLGMLDHIYSPCAVDSCNIVITVIDQIVAYPACADVRIPGGRVPELTYKTSAEITTSALYGTKTLSTEYILGAASVTYGGVNYKMLTPDIEFRGRTSQCLPTKAKLEILCKNFESKLVVNSMIVSIPGEELEIIARNNLHARILEQNRSLEAFVQNGKYTPTPEILGAATVEGVEVRPLEDIINKKLII